MISPEYKKILIDLNSTQYGAVLKEYLNEKILYFENVRTIPPDKDLALEVKARQLALDIIDELFGFMEGVQKTQKNKNQYE